MKPTLAAVIFGLLSSTGTAAPRLGFPVETCDTAIPLPPGFYAGLSVSDYWQSAIGGYDTEYDWYRFTVQPGQQLTVRGHEVSHSPAIPYTFGMWMYEVVPAGCSTLSTGTFVPSLPGQANPGLTVINSSPSVKDYTVSFFVWADLDYQYLDLSYTMNVAITTASTGVEYCPGAFNSTGARATLSISGSNSVAANNLQFTAASLPPNGFGLLTSGTSSTNVPFGDGTRCVAGSLARLYVLPVTPAGTCTKLLDIANLPPSAAIVAGNLRYFQMYYRDSAGAGGSGFNLTNAIAVPFTP